MYVVTNRWCYLPFEFITHNVSHAMVTQFATLPVR